MKLILLKDKPTIHVANAASTTSEDLKPQFKDVVLKAVKAVDNSLTESDFNYFIKSKGEYWPINITNNTSVFVQIEGKNNAIGQTNPIDVINWIIQTINLKIRRCLNWKTPQELFFKYLK